MSKWNYERLDQMTNQKNDFSSISIDYRKLADYLEEMISIATENSDLIPLEFEDVKLAYDGDPFEDFAIENIDLQIQEKLDQKNNERKVMKIKYLSKDISHNDWANFIDNEVLEFIEKYPQYKDEIK